VTELRRHPLTLLILLSRERGDAENTKRLTTKDTKITKRALKKTFVFFVTFVVGWIRNSLKSVKVARD
jgi:hypothetical protein